MYVADYLVGDWLLAGRPTGLAHHQLGQAGRFRVLLQVPVQVCLLAKATITELTFEWALLLVYVPNVPLQV